MPTWPKIWCSPPADAPVLADVRSRPPGAEPFATLDHAVLVYRPDRDGPTYAWGFSTEYATSIWVPLDVTLADTRDPSGHVVAYVGAPAQCPR